MSDRLLEFDEDLPIPLAESPRSEKLRDYALKAFDLDFCQKLYALIEDIFDGKKPTKLTRSGTNAVLTYRQEDGEDIKFTYFWPESNLNYTAIYRPCAHEMEPHPFKTMAQLGDIFNLEKLKQEEGCPQCQQLSWRRNRSLLK